MRNTDLQILGVVLLLISVGTIVGPIGGVVIMYRDNLSQLVVPPQIKSIMNGNNNILQDNSNSNDDNSDSGGGFITPVFVGAQINDEARIFTVTVNVTNKFGNDLTLNSINATVESSQDSYQLGTISLSSPVTIPFGQTSQVIVAGIWTQDAENHIQNNFGDATSIDVKLVNTAIDVNGVIVQQSEPINVGSIPLT